MEREAVAHGIVRLTHDHIVCSCGWSRTNDLSLTMPANIKLSKNACLDHMLDLYNDHVGLLPGR